MQINTDEIIAGYVGNKLFCADCLDINEVESGQDFITESDLPSLEDSLYFCDECGKRIR